jgi:6-phosphogluconolactonase (cycloisomerase 2 family)
MVHKTRSVLSLVLLAGAALACRPVYGQHSDDRDNDGGPAVFVMTNAADRNEVISYKRNADGTLREERHFSTGGRGSGGNNDPLESQGSLTLTQDHSHLLAVNAGSGDISLFRVHGSDLDLSDRVSSGGSEPNSIAQHGDLVYVLNTGGSSNVAGFRLHYGELTPIENSLRFLSTNTSGAASIAFSPNGQFLAVTERLTNSIDVFLVQSDGTLSPLVVNPSAGPGAFSVSFAPNGSAVVSETGASGVPNGSATSSYSIQSNGTLSAITTSAPTLGAANCWNAVTPDGRFVYVSNAGSSTISGFAIGANGSLTALPGTVVGHNPAGATNLDIAVSGDGKFLYTLNAKVGTVGIFSIQNDGTLIPVGSAGGITPNSGFNGIAAQ